MLKKLLFLYALCSVLTSCNQSRGSFSIEGSTNLAEGTIVYLEKKTDNKGIQKVDSTTIKNNTFKFSRNVKGIELYTVTFSSIQGAFYVVAEKGTVKVKVNNDTLYKSVISGTYNNDELQKFNQYISKFQKELNAFEKNNIGKLQMANKTNDLALVNSLKTEFATLQTNLKNKNYDYVKSHPNSFVSVLILDGMIREFEPNYDKIKELFSLLTSEIKSTIIGRKIDAKLKNIAAIEIGKKAPNFTAPKPDGSLTSLQENLGKVTILYFGGSWCEPCKSQNEFYNTLYRELHSKGLNFINVSLEIKGQREQWKKAIKEQKIDWISVSNLNYWNDPVAKLYSIDGFPAIFILDTNGIIVAKNLQGETLKTKIKELLSK